MNTEKISTPKPSQFPEHLKRLEKEDFILVNEGLSFDPEKIQIERNRNIDLFGSDIEVLGEKIDTFLATIGDNSPEYLSEVRQTMLRAIEGMLKDFQAEAAHVMIRTTLPNNKFKVPRWHRDNPFFAISPNNKVYKKVFALKGRPTRFAVVTEKEKFLLLEQADIDNDGSLGDEEDMRIRFELETVVDELSPLAPSQSMVYEIGGNEMVVHSEPDMQEPRIFMSVIVGSREEIEEAQRNS